MIGNSKKRLITILEIMKRTDEEHPINITQLKQKLEESNIHSERKAIGNDLKCLNQMGYTMVQCQNHNLGYYMVDQLFEEYELKMIADAVSAARFLTLKDSLDIINKIKKIATIEGENLINMTTFQDAEIKSDDSKNKYKIDLLLRAIRNEKIVSFQYYEWISTNQKVLKRDGHTYIISPYYLALYNDQYYLIGNSINNYHATHFRLEMITSLEETDKDARPISEIEELKELSEYSKIGKYIRQSVNLWTGNVVDIKFECSSLILNDVYTQFGKGVLIETQESGELLITAKATDAMGVLMWFAARGKLVKILSPEHIRQKYMEYVREILDLYVE